MSSRVKSYLADQLNRLKKMQEAYEQRISELPEGNIYYKHIGRKDYPYLQFRQGRHRTIYVKLEELEMVEKQIKERKSHEQSLKAIKEDINFIDRALRQKS